jgi:kynureninase
MSRHFKDRRPSASMVVAVVALVAALGGTAVAAGKISFGSLSKETKQKVLPYGASASQTVTCDPTDATFKTCVQATVKVSAQFQRRMLVVADGTYTTDATGAKGTCRLQVDGQPIGTGVARIGSTTATHTGDNGAGFGLNAIAPSLGGSHTYSLACNQGANDLKIQDASITAMTMRG